MVRSTCSLWFEVSGGGENTSFATSKLGEENTCFYNGLWLSIWWFCVTICGFCWFLHLSLLYFFIFAEITMASGYWWIWLWVHNREKRKIEVLGFENFVMGS